LAPRERGWS